MKNIETSKNSLSKIILLRLRNTGTILKLLILDSRTFCHQKSVELTGKGKGNVDLYSASSQMPLTRSDTNYTMLPANDTIPALTRKHSPGGATTHSERLSSTYYLFKGLDNCCDAAQISHTWDQRHFTVSEVAADWHELLVLQSCGYLVPTLMDNWTCSAASRHITSLGLHPLVLIR